MTKTEFEELVWCYGAAGTKEIEDLTEKQQEIITITWSEVEKCKTQEQEKNTIDMNYREFMKAS